MINFASRNEQQDNMNIRKVHRIVAKDISQSHPNKKEYQTDAHYAKLANLLLDDFRQLRLDFGEQTSSIMRYTAVMLANYMEDIVADSGQWRSFSALCKQMCGQTIPMYHDANAEYYPDEPSLEAVRFIVWHAATEMDDIWWLLRTNEEKLRVARDEITLDDGDLHQYDGCCAIFVKYLGSWHLNGVMIPTKDIASHWDEFVKNDPDYKAAGTRDVTGEMLLKQTSGKEILYFENQKEMENYLMKNMRYRPEHFGFLKEHDIAGKHPLIFIDKNAKKFALHFSFGFTPCIADPTNPYYDAAIARKEVIEMLWNDQSISTEAIIHLLEHNYLPDIYEDALLSQESSKDEKHSDVLFLLRYMRRENY